MLKQSRPADIPMVLLTTLLIGVLFPVGAQAQTGACCSGAVCFVSSPAGCAGAFPPGAYQGDGSSCPGLCLQQGACCFVDGSCQELFFGPCNVAVGTFQGAGSTCLPNSCPPPAPVPTQINHQGVVSVNGQRFTGTGQFYFAIIDPDTGSSVWTNDATNLGTANRPNQPVLIDCASGLYDVRLGDLSFANMKPIPVNVFSSANRALRIWFNDGTNGVFQLTPDHQLTSMPYAFKAAATGSGIPNTIVFTSSGTWTKPTGLKYVVVEVVGAGGGGGSRSNSNQGSGGGGGGGYSRKNIAAETLGAIETVTIGAGGAGNPGAQPGSGNPGGTTSFGSHLSATGGSGGPIQGFGGIGGSPGNGAGGDLNFSGHPGFSEEAVPGLSGQSAGGAGGATFYGGGDGASYGSGGRGGTGGGSGGNGGAGVVIVTEHY